MTDRVLLVEGIAEKMGEDADGVWFVVPDWPQVPVEAGVEAL